MNGGIDQEILFSPVAPSENEGLAALKTHFPECFDKNGVFLPEKLAESLSVGGIRTAREFYSLNWLGKSYAKVLRDVPPKTLLAEDAAHNRLPENEHSGHLLIKGDNLEVLKHLKNAYKEAVKMIYIDPPYNTGSDGFVYQDDRKFTPAQLAELGGMDLDEAQRVLDFTAKKSNSHSAWLTFMYPRLYIARQLLREDGVIFISIDDNEQAQLKLLCDEVFGGENFVGQMVWHNSSRNSEQIAIEHEYVFCYVKNNCVLTRWKKIRPESDFLNKLIADAKLGGKSLDEARQILCKVVKDFLERGKREKSKKYNWIGNYNNLDGNWKIYYAVDLTGEGGGPPRYFGNKLISAPEGRHWMGQDYINELFENDRIVWRGERAYRKLFIEETESNLKGIIDMPTRNGGESIKQLFNGQVFDKSKPINLISHLASYVSNSDDLILDFFAGSGTTAHALMQLNAEDGGSRRYICVQLPEATDLKSEACKAGYQTIFDITKARIEKAAAKIRAEHPDYQGDLGFKIFETVPDFRPAADADFDPAQAVLPLLQDAALSDADLHTLLTTWRVYDGQTLSEKVQTLDLAGFPAALCGKHLYLLHQGFHSAAVKALIERLDGDADFTPERIVLYGANMDSAMQRELAQAVESYANKKSLNISVLARY